MIILSRFRLSRTMSVFCVTFHSSTIDFTSVLLEEKNYPVYRPLYCYIIFKCFITKVSSPSTAIEIPVVMYFLFNIRTRRTNTKLNILFFPSSFVTDDGASSSLSCKNFKTDQLYPPDFRSLPIRSYTLIFHR